MHNTRVSETSPKALSTRVDSIWQDQVLVEDPALQTFRKI